MKFDTIMENEKFLLRRCEYKKNDVIWFVVNKEREKSLVFRRKKTASRVYRELSKMEGLS